MAKMIGLAAMVRIISGVKAPFEESPKSTSAPLAASSRVRSGVSTAKRSLYLFIPSVRPWKMTPLVSHMSSFSLETPREMARLAQAIAAAPAPFTTIRTSPIFFPTNSRALIRAALAMMAVPC